MTFSWWTYALQVVNFLILVWLLKRFLYEPVMKAVQDRKAMLGTAMDEAESARQAAQKEKAGYVAQKKALAAERQTVLAEARSDAAKERDRIVAAAKAKADDAMRAAKATIDQERQAVLGKLKQEAAGVAVALAEQILGASTSPDLSTTFLDRLEEKIVAIPAGERRALTRDLALNGSAVLIVTSHELADADKETWKKRLARALGHRIVPSFETDASLIDGAELRFAHATITYSWAEELARARQELEALHES